MTTADRCRTAEHHDSVDTRRDPRARPSGFVALSRPCCKRACWRSAPRRLQRTSRGRLGGALTSRLLPPPHASVRPRRTPRSSFVPGSRLVSGDWDACLPTAAGTPVMSGNCGLVPAPLDLRGPCQLTCARHAASVAGTGTKTMAPAARTTLSLEPTLVGRVVWPNPTRRDSGGLLVHRAQAARVGWEMGPLTLGSNSRPLLGGQVVLE